MGLSALQRRVLEIIRSDVRSADGFALAGGGALILHGIVDRPTDDLDLFTTEARDVALAADEAVQALAAAGLAAEIIRSGASFTRILVRDEGSDAQTLLDLAWDARVGDLVEQPLGPVLSVRELAADKTLALFGRAEARDLVDVRALVERLGAESVLELAAEKDTGFDRYVFAQMLVMAERRPDADFPLGAEELQALRAWSREWRTALIDEIAS